MQNHQLQLSTCLSDEKMRAGQNSGATPTAQSIPTATNTKQVRDVKGQLWDVVSSRPTKHGFDLFLGYLNGSIANGRRRPRFILTPELAAYWQVHHEPGAKYDLPASASSVQNMRFQLGLDDQRLLWRDRKRDLKKMRLKDVAKRYGVSYNCARQWRMKLLGRVARPLNWWRDPAVLEVLCSGLSDRQISHKYFISASHAYRLRHRALELKETRLFT